MPSKESDTPVYTPLCEAEIQRGLVRIYSDSRGAIILRRPVFPAEAGIQMVYPG